MFWSVAKARIYSSYKEEKEVLRVNDCFFVLLLIVPSSLADPVGVFDYTEDIGNYHGGGTVIELHEVLMDGARILLNDVANGGSAVSSLLLLNEPVLTALLNHS